MRSAALSSFLQYPLSVPKSCLYYCACIWILITEHRCNLVPITSSVLIVLFPFPVLIISFIVGFHTVIYHIPWRWLDVCMLWYIRWWPVGVVAVSCIVGGLIVNLWPHGRRIVVPVFSDDMAMGVVMHHVAFIDIFRFSCAGHPLSFGWGLRFIRGLIFLGWAIFWGLSRWGGLSWWRGFTCRLGSCISGRRAAACFWLGAWWRRLWWWWWLRSARVSVGADCSYLFCLLDGFYQSLWIGSSYHLQLLLRKIDIDIVYTCRIQSHRIKNSFSWKSCFYIAWGRDILPSMLCNAFLILCTQPLQSMRTCNSVTGDFCNNTNPSVQRTLKFHDVIIIRDQE